MIRIVPTSTLSADFVRVFPGDEAFDQAAPDVKERVAKFHETGDWSHLEPIIKPGEKPCRFRLRHLRGRVSEELADLLAPTLGADNITASTLILLASLSLHAVEDWDGPPLEWRTHKSYQFRVPSNPTLDLLCTVPSLVPWLGAEALNARVLSPKP